MFITIPILVAVAASLLALGLGLGGLLDAPNKDVIWCDGFWRGYMAAYREMGELPEPRFIGEDLEEGQE